MVQASEQAAPLPLEAGGVQQILPLPQREILLRGVGRDPDGHQAVVAAGAVPGSPLVVVPYHGRQQAHPAVEG